MRVYVWRWQIWLPKQIEDGAIRGDEVGDFPRRYERSQCCWHFFACQFVETENRSVEVTGSLQIMHIQGNVV
jgi:hypothetical protein